MIEKTGCDSITGTLLKICLSLLICGLVFQIISKSVQHPIRLWDESLYANNGLEMAKNGQYLVYTVADTVDHHNTKPPLVLWMQAAAGDAFGFSELSVRLPTYTAMIGLMVMLIVYLRRFTRSFLPGLLAALFCLTTLGLIRHHVFLSGDLDGMLVFWSSWITFHWIECLRKQTAQPQDYAILTALFCAGYFTKSTAILLIIPSLLVISCFYWKRCRSLIISRRTIWSTLVFFVFCASFYLVRERYDPG